MPRESMELADIQAIVTSGHGALPHARFLLLAFNDAAPAREWLSGMTTEVRNAAAGPSAAGTALQLAFTHAGLTHLELPWQALKGFAREFEEGMTGSERRSRILGDVDHNAPRHWQWGAAHTPAIHALMMIYADSADGLDALTSAQQASLAKHEIDVVQTLDSSALAGHREHFGFRDGISQPKIDGLGSDVGELHRVPPGEVMLGYTNGRDELTAGPLVDPIEDPLGLLSPARGEQRDFGRNGSYLVFRQLAQDVHGFWSWAERSAGSVQDAVRLAAKMVGRWPSGASLVLSPDADDAALALHNDFDYHHADIDGLKCPLGAHVRRTNPRDMLAPSPGSEKSLAINRRHRLMRRGRSYGAPLSRTLDPADVLVRGDDGQPRGLHFLCLNASISRQFEFVQHTWANNPNFAGLHADTDPLIGDRRRGADTFTCPADPVRKRHHGLPHFVTVRGGAYFFVPGVRALRYLASGPKRIADEYSAPAAAPNWRREPWWLAVARVVNDVLAWSITTSRRMTTLRNLFDSLFQQPLTDLLQACLQWRRRRHGVDADLAPGEEREYPCESEIAQRITEQMTAFLYRHYRHGTAERAGNTKTYGLLAARFEVDATLAPDLQEGVFEAGRVYDAWVRLGGPGPLAPADMRDNGVLSIGVKLTGVPGPKLLDEQGSQDFTAISAPTFTTPDVGENLKLQQHVGDGLETFYFLNPFDSHYLDGMLQALYAKAHGSPLETGYWSCVPFRFGEGRVMKYRFVPRTPARTRVPFPAPANYLREAMTRHLSEHEAVFDFCVQFQQDAQTMPIENSSVIWRSPWRRIATLHIPAQAFATAERDLLARRITINPWHAVPAHRPLGNQNRARKAIYLQTARVRQRINDETHTEDPAEDPASG